MFKQIKSAVFWYYLYKFRKKVLLISSLIIVAFFANSIYDDIVQYLTLKEKLEYLEIALISKWSIIIFNLLFSIYLTLSIFKREEKKHESKKEDNTKSTNREEMFLNKKDLKSHADILVER